MWQLGVGFGGGRFKSNPNLLFIFYFHFFNLIIRFSTNPNLTCGKKIIIYFILYFSIFIKVEGFHP